MIKVLMLLAFVMFYLPPVHKILVPVLSYFYSSTVLHYPRYYLVLPHIYNFTSSYIIELIFGIALYAAAVFAIGADYLKEKGGFSEGLRTAKQSLLTLVPAWLIKTAIVFTFFSFGGKLMFSLLSDYSYKEFFGYFIIQMGGLLLSAALIFTIPAIILHRQSLKNAIISSLKIFGRFPAFSFILLIVPWFITMPVRYLFYTKTYIILSSFNHTILIYLLLADIILEIIANYLLYAGITYFYLERTES